METDLLSSIGKSFIFSSLDKKETEDIFARIEYQTKVFEKNDIIPYYRNSESYLGIIVSGEAKIYSENGKAIINIIGEGGAFGVSSLFSNEKEISRIIASRETKVLFIKRDEFEKMLENEKIRTSLLRFLTDRIRFLNKKLDSFSQSNTEKKFASYLLANEINSLISVKNSYTELAKALGIGRASLYRLLDSFEENKLIIKNEKSIKICSKDKLLELLR